MGHISVVICGSVKPFPARPLDPEPRVEVRKGQSALLDSMLIA
jgi:hypothetical protein